ncbi:MAG: hypothetical protein NTW87_34370, partial [Planctomycetota bacterium]|nr:hypothetical protein [Planctomycetota bacterium]
MRSRNNQDQFVFRTINWENGQIIGEQVLPGTPGRLEDNSFRTKFVQCGSTLVYSARDGVFAYTAVDEPVGKVVEKLRAELATTELPNERRRSARRALVDLDPPSWMAFVAPAGTRIDGDLGEWQGTEPMTLRGPLHYVPLGNTTGIPVPGAAEGGWKGDEDLSA